MLSNDTGFSWYLLVSEPIHTIQHESSVQRWPRRFCFLNAVAVRPGLIFTRRTRAATATTTPSTRSPRARCAATCGSPSSGQTGACVFSFIDWPGVASLPPLACFGLVGAPCAYSGRTRPWGMGCALIAARAVSASPAPHCRFFMLLRSTVTLSNNGGVTWRRRFVAPNAVLLTMPILFAVAWITPTSRTANLCLFLHLESASRCRRRSHPLAVRGCV